MSKHASEIIGLKVEATDGLVGKVKDFFFDDGTWNVRYYVVDTGSWLNSREVLMSPGSISGFDPKANALITSLTRQQVEASPPVLSDAPISRLYEQQLHNHYDWPYYWGCGAFGGAGLYAYPPIGDVGLYPDSFGRMPENDLARDERIAMEAHLADANPQLKSFIDVRGYDIHASDGDIGHVHDFVLDDAMLHLTSLIIDTHNWLPANLVDVCLNEVNHIDWGQGEVIINRSRADIRDAEKEAIASLAQYRNGKSRPSALTASSETLL